MRKSMRFWKPAELEASTLKVTVSLGMGGGSGAWSSAGVSCLATGDWPAGVDGVENGADSFFGVEKISFFGVTEPGGRKSHKNRSIIVVSHWIKT